MRKLSLFAISCYQFFVSPLLKQILGGGSMCKQSPTCSQYARSVFSKEPFFLATKKTFLRIAACR